jgi:hypothetical protein
MQKWGVRNIHLVVQKLLRDESKEKKLAVSFDHTWRYIDIKDQQSQFL